MRTDAGQCRHLIRRFPRPLRSRSATSASSWSPRSRQVDRSGLVRLRSPRWLPRVAPRLSAWEVDKIGSACRVSRARCGPSRPQLACGGTGLWSASGPQSPNDEDHWCDQHYDHPLKCHVGRNEDLNEYVVKRQRNVRASRGTGERYPAWLSWPPQEPARRPVAPRVRLIPGTTVHGVIVSYQRVSEEGRGLEPATEGL